jgi:hypothetical protein
MSEFIHTNTNDDGIDRRGFLRCMAWAGTFHTARGTAFPLPIPGSVPKPVPVIVEASKLKKTLGITSVSYIETNHTLAVVDSTLD